MGELLLQIQLAMEAKDHKWVINDVEVNRIQSWMY